MPIDLKAESRPIDVSDPRYATMLANLQGNILKSHGRDYAFHIFFRVGGDALAARKLVAALSAYVTSAAEQAVQTAGFNRGGEGGVFGALMLSAKGLAVLGRALPAGFGEASATQPPVLVAKPMKDAAAALGDDPALWDARYQAGDIDGLLILAAGKEMAPFGPDAIPTALLAASRSAQDVILAGGGSVAGLEIGQQQRRGDDAVEHFGYVDGISQPILIKQDLPDPGKMTRNDPSAGLSLALVADPLTDAPDAFGSFYVFRKLEQNVAAFRAAEAKLAADLKLTDPKLAEGMIVGRFRNGVPVVLAGTDAGAEAKENNFDYSGDPAPPKPGLPAKCPFHAHIRKTNPRGDIDRQFGATDRDAGERSRRIVRRGITYGARDADMADAPTGGVGLLFQCYQASIPSQFAFMQHSWANNPDFVRPGATGQDPVIGQGKRTPQTWPVVWGGPGHKTTDDIGQFVTNRGGEFFFAPSLPFFKGLV